MSACIAKKAARIEVRDIAFFVAGCIVGFLLGLHESNMRGRIAELRKPKEPEPKTGATYTAPEFVNESTIGQEDDSAIVLPKSPQRLEFEEQEELRKMNLRPR